jgi:hypothetical protein
MSDEKHPSSDFEREAEAPQRGIVRESSLPATSKEREKGGWGERESERATHPVSAWFGAMRPFPLSPFHPASVDVAQLPQPLDLLVGQLDERS